MKQQKSSSNNFRLLFQQYPLLSKFTCIIIFSALPFLAISQQKLIDIQTKDVSLSTIITQLENRYDYLFSYKIDDVKNIIITESCSKKGIDEFLKKILKNTGLEHEIINGNYIILKKSKKLDNELSKAQEDNGFQICGQVFDSISQKPLSYANVYLKKSQKGDFAGEDGAFNFNYNLSRNDTVVVSYVGYAERFIPVNFFIKNPCPKIKLSYSNYEIDGIIITDYLTDGIDLADNGAATVLRPERIGALPGQAEPDVFTTLQFLPGINAPNGGASDLYIRGGAADQNLILWEGIPIYHASHYFGMISAFNPYIIDKMKVYRGGFGAEYGGRASSVIDMQTADYKDLNKSEFGAGVNFINAYTQGKLTSKKKTASLVYSLRRSLSELWRSPTFENITQRNQQSVIEGNFDFSNLPKGVHINDGFYFLDSHVKAAAQLSPKDNLAIAFFYGKNDFDNNVTDLQKKEKQIDILDLKSDGLSVAYEREWTPHFSSKLMAVNTLYDYKYKYEIDQLDIPPPVNRFGNKDNRLKEQQLHISNIYTTAKKQDIKFGYQHTNAAVKYQIRHESNSALLAKEQADEVSNIDALYVEYNSPQKNIIGLDAGFRYSYFGKLDQQYFAPRLRLWYNMSDHISWQGNVGKYYQYTSQLVQFKGDFLGIDTPIWVLSNDRNVPVICATQYQLGIVYNKNAWVVDVQAYIKNIKGLSALATSFNTGPAQIKPGDSDSKGVDILLKKRWKNFRAWASYSLSITTYHFPTFNFPEFPAPFDQRHVLNLATQWSKGNFELALGFSIYSGTPYSIMDSFESVPDNMGHILNVPIYENYNNYHVDVQHHLDASILYKFGGKNQSKLHGAAGLSFFNIYNQKNIYDRDYFIGKAQNGVDEIKVNDYQGLGFTPNAVFRVTW
ncbi:MAG: TonB-dependent receptor plug domain-containing protein [Bacteroidetes bacterium]|nr:TonB-dependent receptor plug domain-containing protein [Bacteroidota bacterium]